MPSDGRFGPLPYGESFNRLLPALHKAFLEINRWYAVPAIRLGLGPLHANPFTSAFMLLRTKGRKSGLVREVPLGYTILDGSVYCVAGFGEQTQWFRNIQADPKVEVVLPGSAFAGMAELVTDRDEWLRGYRALVRDLGFIGRLTVVDVRTASDELLLEKTQGLPLVRIRPTGIAKGPMDPGGWFWAVPAALTGAWLARWLGRRIMRPGRRSRCECCGWTRD
jgi:deazaflavin-dependent oxidoreductase (nitroreductase family)